jgi:glycosyltransferase domain-containing protein
VDGLEKLSIVIPTYGRHDFVRRQISYWSDSAVTVHIMDGSPDPIESEFLVNLPPNIKYRHSNDDFFARMCAATEVIDTPYVAMLGDDDLFVKSGLKRCIEHLDDKAEVFGVVGRSMYFFHQRGVVFGEPKHSEATNYERDIQGGISRLHNLYHPGKIGAVAYGVFRSDQWKPVIRATYAKRYSSGYVYDTFLRTLLTYTEEIEVVEAVTWLCSGENPPIKNQSSFNRSVDLIEWLDDPKFKDEVMDFKSRLVAEALVIKSEEEAVMVCAIDFVVGTLEERYREKANRRVSFREKLPRMIKAMAPGPMKQVAKSILPRSITRKLDWQGIQFLDCLNLMEQRGVYVDRKEMSTIAEMIWSFHQ